MNPIFFRSVARTALRAAKPASAANRALSLSAVRRSGAPMPALFGEGSKPGEVPTDINQSTGLDRLQILGALEGVEVFDLNPLDASRVGTLENPILVYSLVCFCFPFRLDANLCVTIGPRTPNRMHRVSRRLS